MTPILVPDTRAEWEAWLRSGLPELVLILAGVVAAQWLLRQLTTRVIRRVVRRAAEARGQDAAAAERRTQTIVSVVNWSVTIVVVFIGVALVLDTFGLNVTALVASAGIVGLALSFGAQQFVRDLINGTFILAENQYGVGDIVSIAGVSGVVIDVNPRRTMLRDLNGHVHIVPNGVIQVATNMTRDFARVNVDISFAYEEDTDRVIRVINTLCEEFAAERPGDFITVPKVLRVEMLAESGVVVKVTGDVRPFLQWELMGELRRRVRERFREEGIEIPYPHRVTLTKDQRRQPRGLDDRPSAAHDGEPTT